MSFNTKSSIRVAVRVRPASSKEQQEKCVIDVDPDQGLVSVGDRRFNFDYACPPDMTQEEFYEACVKPLFQQFVEGYNATILAYGQTGSGKTYTMGTGQSSAYTEMGIVPRFAESLFALVDGASSDHQYAVSVSFLELNGEKPRDLLQLGSDVRINVRENQQGIICWVGMREEPVKTPDALLLELQKGSKARNTASTDMNATSSRSHAIFSVTLSQELPDKVLVSKFHFVDLAGSERLKKTNATGDRAKEGIAINTGLLALGNVISALSEKLKHVPYRDSMLTRLLQDSLGGNSQTLMLACASPAKTNENETVNTLMYASRARNIKNRASVNQEMSEVDRLKAKVARLEQELKAANNADARQLRDENDRLRAELSHLKREQGNLTGLVNASETDAQTGTEALLGQYARMIEKQRNELLNMKRKPSASTPRRLFAVSSSSRRRTMSNRNGKQQRASGRHSRENSGSKTLAAPKSGYRLDLGTIQQLQAALQDEIELADTCVKNTRTEQQLFEVLDSGVQSKKQLLTLLDDMEAKATFDHVSSELKREGNRKVQQNREVKKEIKQHELYHSQLEKDVQKLEKQLNNTQDCLDKSDTKVSTLRQQLKKAIEDKKGLMQTVKLEANRARQSSDNFKREILQLKKQEAGRKRLERELMLQKQSYKRVTEDLASHGSHLQQMASELNVAMKKKTFDSKLLAKAIGSASIRSYMVKQTLAKGGVGSGRAPLSQRVEENKCLIDYAISIYASKQKIDRILHGFNEEKKALKADQKALLDERCLWLKDGGLDENSTKSQLVDESIDLLDENIDLITAKVSFLERNMKIVQSRAHDEKVSPAMSKDVQMCLSPAADPEVAYECARAIVRCLDAEELLLMSELLLKDLMDCKADNKAHALLNISLKTSAERFQEAVVRMRRNPDNLDGYFTQVVSHRIVNGLAVVPEEVNTALQRQLARPRVSVPAKKRFL